MIELELFPARYGDCIWLRYGSSPSELRHVLIDTGFGSTADALRQRMRDTGAALDLFVLTHIDADHIEGAITFLQDPEIATPERIRDIWFNGWPELEVAANDSLGPSATPERIGDVGFNGWPELEATANDSLGPLQGEYFSALVRRARLPLNRAFNGRPVMVPDEGSLPIWTNGEGLTLTLLSPNAEALAKLRSHWVRDLKGRLRPGDEREALELLDADTKYELDELGSVPNVEKLVMASFEEDRAPANGSSIAFLAEYDGTTMLFCGDAHPSIIADSLERLVGVDGSLDVDVWKLSHHGSRHNTSPCLTSRVRPRHVLVSTDGTKFHHPDMECIARVIKGRTGVILHFNYESDENRCWASSALRKNWRYEVDYGNAGSIILRL